MSNPSCPRCRGAMEDGFVLDKGDNNRGYVPHWFEGQPEASFWCGVKSRGRRSYPIRVLRCRGCGYLEAYAREDAGARRA